MSQKLIAILRGLVPEQAVEIGAALIDAGITRIEVPLNSPSPLESIRLLVDRFAESAEIGAGTVLNVQDVKAVADTGAGLIVSPNCDAAVINETKKLGLTSLPGVMTPSECFAALSAGADGLKLFPASLLGPDGLKAIRAVLPPEVEVFPVGGVAEADMAAWVKAGANGFGIGSSLFRPGDDAEKVSLAAKRHVQSYDKARAHVG